MSQTMKLRAKGGAIRRFVSPKIHLGEDVGLSATHPAVVEGRTLFPTTVVPPLESPALFVSGHNNSKLGGKVMKGPLKGMPIFHLTLEERKTCPRSCDNWMRCYGNGMHMARRHDALDPYFMAALRGQAAMLARTFPDGVLIRLHTLGDFFSVEYVRQWGALLTMHGNLHVFGYTAHPRDSEIGAAIAAEADMHWERFAIRFSGTEVRAQGAITVPGPSTDPDVIMCPAQHTDDHQNKTEACATCGICWSASARNRCIGFLIHGRRLKSYNDHLRGGRQRRSMTTLQEALWREMLARADSNGLVVRNLVDLCDDAGVDPESRYSLLRSLTYKQRVVRCLRTGNRGRTAVYQVFEEPQAEWPPAPALPAPPRKGKAPTRPPTHVRSNIPGAVAPDRSGKPRNAPSLSRSSFVLSPYDGKGRVIRPWLIGTADQFDIGTPEQRIAAVPDEEKARIAATYGASFKE